MGQVKGVTRSELSRTSVAFLYFFTVITSYYVVRAIRTGEFLSFIGAEQKPWADIVVALLMLPCLRGYHFLVDRLPRRAFLGVGQLVFAVQLACFGALNLSSPAAVARGLEFLASAFPALPRLPVFWVWLAACRGIWSAAAFYLWVAIFNLFMVTMCWSVINDVFRVGAARRRYGLIAAGGPLGGMAGGSLTAVFVTRLQPGGMLFVSAAFVLVCVALSHLLLRLSEGQEAELPTGGEGAPSPGTEPGEGEASDEMEGISSYAGLIARVVGLSIVVASLFNYQFNVYVKAMVPGRTELTALYGAFDMALNMVALFASLLLTPWILKGWGPRVGLRVLPAVYLVSCLVLVFVAPFWFLVIMGVLASGLTYSLNKASQEVLYVPTGRRLKYKAKSFIDTFLFRFAGASASVFILLLTAVVTRPATWIYLSGLIVCGLWLLTVSRLASDYERLSKAVVQIEEGEGS